MQPRSLHAKSIHGAAPGFRVLDQDAATAVVRRQMRPAQARPSLASLPNEWDSIQRRADRSIDFDFYRRRATAPRARAPRNAAVWLSAGAGVLTMATIYLVLLFAAAYMRAPNFHVPAPAVAIPNAPDVIF
jgi:hypothetical protein